MKSDIICIKYMNLTHGKGYCIFPHILNPELLNEFKKVSLVVSVLNLSGKFNFGLYQPNVTGALDEACITFC